MTKKTSSKAAKLGCAKLESSGLDPKYHKKLGLEFLGPEQTAKLHKAFKPLCSLKINYYGPDGKPVADVPTAKPFYRLRYLETATDFASLTDKKPIRYVQEPNTAPVAYFPLNQDWTDIIGNPDVPVILTEGELKALKACHEGFPTIGLGGVYNWRSHKLGIEWLPSLESVVWLRRNVYICFDSDFSTNVMVCMALKELADALQRRGAFVNLVALPAIPGLKKVGLDDFFVAAGGATKENFVGLLHEAEPLGLSKPLWNFNSQYVYVQSPGLVVNQATRAKCNPSAFKDHVASTETYQERALRKDGEVSYRATSAAAAWLCWPHRREVAALTYQPGDPSFVDGKFNIWPGWGLTPAAGDITLFETLLDHLFKGSEPESLQWFLRWCAYPLKYPGAKLFSSVTMHGIRHGTGKSLIGYTLGRIYGENFTEINQMDLHSSFNEWCEGKQFVMGDDVTGSDKRADADFLKKLITQKQIRVNAKYVPSYVVPDCINYFFTANHPDSFFLEDDDRRFFIHEVVVGPLPEEFYVEYDLWLDSGGAAAVFDYLLKLDLGDFNPAAPAFRTAAKERMIVNVQSDLATWVRQLIATPDQILRLGEIVIKKDLFSSKELLTLYNPTGTHQLTANGLARELARAGVRQVCAGKPIMAMGSQARYFAIRNPEVWLGKTAKECASHIENWVNSQQTKKKY